MASLSELCAEAGEGESTGLLGLLVGGFPDLANFFETFNFDREDAKVNRTCLEKKNS
jgi:hypothetical protein